MSGGAFRVGAFAIAAIAVVDPALKTSRSSRPTVAVLTTDSSASSSLENRIVRALDRRFTVIRGRFDAAAATVVIGRNVPNEAETLAKALMAVVPTEAGASVRLTKVEAPATVALNARTPVHVDVSVQGARGRRLTLQLRAGGATVDQAIQNVDVDSGRIALVLHHVPLRSGPQALVVKVTIDGSNVSDSAFTVTNARPDRYAVLFHDARPSWSSTFVRRAVEEDSRFSVTHRVVTSRAVSNTGGPAPASLRDAPSLSGYATIVVGAPQTLTAADIAGLEAFMRQRGGSVVVLMEGNGAGQLDRLAGVMNWRTARTNTIATFVDITGFGALQGRETSWPAVRPIGSTIYVSSVGRDSTRRDIVWSVPVGAGRLLLSGALDAWEHRGDSSGFNAFWTGALAELSSRAPGAISIELTRRALRPGEKTLSRVTLRNPLLSGAPVRAGAVGAALVSSRDSTSVRLWPELTPGVFSGTLVAPRQPGDYTLVVWTDTERSESPIVVDAAARLSNPDEPDVLRSFVSSRGGSVVAENDIGSLPDRLSSAIRPVSRVETWHPMRSPWWIVPFALLLGAEWWLRRRSGLA